MDLGLLVAGLAALPLIPLMSGSWYCLPAGSFGGEGAVTVSPDRCYSAWTSFAVIDLVLMVTVVAVVTLVVLAVRRRGFPVHPGPVMTLLGGFSFLLVAWRLVSPPFAGAGRAGAPFLAAVCLLAVTGGGVLSSRLRSAAETRHRKGEAGPRSGGGGSHRGGRPAVAAAGRDRPRITDINRSGRPR